MWLQGKDRTTKTYEVHADDGRIFRLCAASEVQARLRVATYFNLRAGFYTRLIRECPDVVLNSDEVIVVDSGDEEPGRASRLSTEDQ